MGIPASDPVAQPAQSREILNRKTNAVENGYLEIANTTKHPVGKHLPDFCNGVVLVQLLNVTRYTGLRLEFDKTSERNRISRWSSVLP